MRTAIRPTGRAPVVELSTVRPPLKWVGGKYLNRTGYNGLCRFNKTGGFNVPFGTYARRISCTGDRTPAPEILATRNLA